MEGFFHLSEFHKQAPSSDLAPKCGACGLYKTCESPKIKPWGNGALRVLIVGEAPGKTEDEQDRPFVGPSGQYLREAIGRVGYNFQEDILSTNAIICRPPNNKLSKDAKEVGYCRANLVKTIRKFKPKVIITLGRKPLQSVLAPFWKDDIGILDRWIGWTIPTKDYWICPTWHPSFLLREENKLMDRMFLGHLEAALKLHEKPSKIPDLTDRVTKLYDERAIYEAVRKFDQAGRPCAFDYETNCLKPEYPEARIFSCAISDGETTIAYPFFGKAITATSMFLKSGRTKKIASHLKYEERWTIKHLGHPVSNWDWDTYLGAHALDNRPGICSLKFQSFVLLGIPSYNEPIAPYLESVGRSHYNRIKEIETGMLLEYNGLDAYLEVRIARRQQRQIGLALNSD